MHDLADVSCTLVPPRDSTRAGRIPSRGIVAGSTQTSEGRLRSFSSSILAVTRPSASVGIGHTRNVWSNFRPSKTKETCCWPLMFRASPVNPYGFMDVALTSLCDTPGWSIETLDPVSTIRRFGSTSISNETVGKPCSSRTETVGLSTAFPCVSRWRELPSLSPLNRFHGSWFPVCLPGSWGRGFIAGRAGRRRTPARIFLSRRVSGSCSL